MPSCPPTTACNTITAINVTGGDGANVITLTGVTAAAYSALTKTTINAGAGDDQIFGSELVDEMHGGTGNDQIIGDDNPAGTRDVFEGEAGDDVLIWRGGEDDDIMNGGDGADSIQVNGAGVAEAFTVKPSATAGRVSFDRLAAPGPGAFNLDIGTAERLELNANGGDDSLDSDCGPRRAGLQARHPRRRRQRHPRRRRRRRPDRGRGRQRHDHARRQPGRHARRRAGRRRRRHDDLERR